MQGFLLFFLFPFWVPSQYVYLITHVRMPQLKLWALPFFNLHPLRECEISMMITQASQIGHHCVPVFGLDNSININSTQLATESNGLVSRWNEVHVQKVSVYFELLSTRKGLRGPLSDLIGFLFCPQVIWINWAP